MRTRAERRELNARKWNKLLKKVYGDPFWVWIKDYENGIIKVSSFEVLKNSHLGKLMKNTGTLSHNQKSFPWHSPWTKDFKKRDIANKKIPKEQMEEAEESMDLYAFESYCVNCDRFETDECPFRGKVFEATKWETIGCESFMD